MVQLKNISKTSFPPGCEIRQISGLLALKPLYINELWKAGETKKFTFKSRYPDEELKTQVQMQLFSNCNLKIGEAFCVTIESVSLETYEQA